VKFSDYLCLLFVEDGVRRPSRRTTLQHVELEGIWKKAGKVNSAKAYRKQIMRIPVQLSTDVTLAILYNCILLSLESVLQISVPSQMNFRQ
jgi:hypothetical protein